MLQKSDFVVAVLYNCIIIIILIQVMKDFESLTVRLTLPALNVNVINS